MNRSVLMQKLLYIKNGDVAAQLARIAETWPGPITSGPDAFLFDLVAQNQHVKMRLLSRAAHAGSYGFKQVSALVFPERYPLVGKAPARVMAFVRVLAQALKFRPDRILCGTTGAPLWASFLAARMLSIPLVHSRHNRASFESEPWYRRIALAIDRYFLRRMDGAICHGPYLKQELREAGVSEHKLFEFDVGFSDLKKDLNRNPEASVPAWTSGRFLLYMGRIERNKGIFDLLNAFGKLSSDYPDLQLVFAGQGRHFEELKRTVQERGFTQVRLLGRVPHQDLAPIIEKCLCVVTPTHADFPEGRCMAAMEGLVLGVPVIASSFGPFLYLVEHGENGLLFEPGSVADLQAQIKALLDDQALTARLRAGANRSGLKLIEPVRTFAVAAEDAFAAANTEACRTAEQSNR